MISHARMPFFLSDGQKHQSIANEYTKEMYMEYVSIHAVSRIQKKENKARIIFIKSSPPIVHFHITKKIFRGFCLSKNKKGLSIEMSFFACILVYLAGRGHHLDMKVIAKLNQIRQYGSFYDMNNTTIWTIGGCIDIFWFEFDILDICALC